MSQAVKIAREWINTPYYHQHSAKAIACDCLGLVRGVGSELGAVPHNLHEIDPVTIGYGMHPYGLMVPCFQRYCDEIDISKREIGDILIFRIRIEPQHCGFFSYGNAVIHAHQSLGMVKEHIMGEKWEKRITNVFRFKL